MKEPKLLEIQRAVAKWSGITVGRLLSRDRDRANIRARLIAMYLARKLTSRPYPVIGHYFAGRDHSCIFNAVRRVMESEDLMREAEECERLILRTDVIDLPGVFPWCGPPAV